MSSQAGNPTPPCPSSARLPMKYKLQRGPCGRARDRETPTPSVLSPQFFFFFSLVKDEPSLFSSATCAVFTQVCLEAPVPSFICNKLAASVFPASFLGSHVLTPIFSSLNQLCVCVKRTKLNQYKKLLKTLRSNGTNFLCSLEFTFSNTFIHHKI